MSGIEGGKRGRRVRTAFRARGKRGLPDKPPVSDEFSVEAISDAYNRRQSSNLILT